jgi:uncharacterized membrane protein YphA (DoxX/SURF4 family)
VTPRLGLGILLRTLVGLFLLAAGVLKLADPAEFVYEMTTYKVVGSSVAAVAAPALIACEIALAAALFAGLWPRRTAAITCLLFLGFIGVVWRGEVIGRTGGCGCFGSYVQRTPAEAIGEDAAAIGATLLAAWLLRGRPGLTGRRAVAIGGAAAAAALLLVVASPRLPIDRYVTRLDVGRSLADLSLAGRVPGLENGRHLVALLDVTRPESAAAAAALGALAGRPGAPAVIALTPSSEEEVAAFLWTAVPAFEVRSIERSTLKPLYRRLPRYVLLSDGEVVAIFDGAPPEAKDLLSSEPP